MWDARSITPRAGLIWAQLISSQQSSIVAFLLLLQPDFGSLAVVTAISFGLLFVAGAGLLKYLLILGVVGLVGAGLVWLQPYRMARVLSFLDPWQDPFGEGYQLTQSLMAFGRGGLWGEGIGNSIQKLGYLPEAHTDFVMAIVGNACLPQLTAYFMHVNPAVYYTAYLVPLVCFAFCAYYGWKGYKVID